MQNTGTPQPQYSGGLRQTGGWVYHSGNEYTKRKSGLVITLQCWCHISFVVEQLCKTGEGRKETFARYSTGPRSIILFAHLHAILLQRVVLFSSNDLLCTNSLPKVDIQFLVVESALSYPCAAGSDADSPPSPIHQCHDGRAWGGGVPY